MSSRPLDDGSAFVLSVRTHAPTRARVTGDQLRVLASWVTIHYFMLERSPSMTSRSTAAGQRRWLPHHRRGDGDCDAL